MSSASYNQFQFSLIKKKVTLFAVLDIGSSGAVTLKAWNPPSGAAAGTYSNAITTSGSPGIPAGTQGIAGVVKESGDGKYTITLQGSFARLLGARATFLVTTTGIPAAPIMGVIGVAPAVASVPATIVLQFSAPQITKGQIDADATATLGCVATNPASGERILVELELDDSSTI